MIKHDLNSLSLLVDFKVASSVGAACLEAILEAVQCALEELHCSDSGLHITSFCSEFVNWFSKDNLLSWECRFDINRVRNVKQWFQNITISEYNKTDFRWFNLWRDKCIHCQQRMVIQIGINLTEVVSTIKS